MNKIDKKTSKKIIFLLFSALLLVGIFTFKDYGIGVDEEFQRYSGFYWLNYVLSFTSLEELKNLVHLKLTQIKGFTLPRPIDHPFYGIVFDLPVAFLEVIFKIDDSENYYYLRHFLVFFLFFVSAIYFYKLLLNRFSNYTVSLIGVLFFILSPRIYGGSFFNNKDVVFLSILTIALYYCFKALDKANFKNFLIFSIFAALETSLRVFGIFLPIFFILFYLLSFVAKNENIKNLFLLIFFCISFVLFLILFWPFLWSAPFENFISALQHFSNHPVKIKMLFNGTFIDSNFLPYSYIFTWIFITNPILYTLLFLIGYFLIFKRFYFRFINIKEKNYYYDLWRSNKEKKDLFILLSITSLIFYLIAFNANLYNGWRQIYFINIFIIYIATFAFYKIYTKSKPNLKKTQFYFVILFLTFVVYKMIIFHPYQNIYFNELVRNEIHKKYEIDYWGLSGKKFLKQVLELEKDKKLIKIGVTSFLPLQRSLKLLNEKERKKIKIIGQDFANADYLYNNFISEVDKRSNDKYEIPSNFTKINEFVLNDVKVYESYKKND
tara:strand:- start:384 stop:2033 length:1650 start_codon:yes stop_codon:yes gene_type:complete